MLFDNMEFHNVQDMIPDEATGGYRMSRLPRAVREACDPAVQDVSFYGSGVEIRFRMPGDEIALYLSRGPQPSNPGGREMLEVLRGAHTAGHIVSHTSLGEEKTRIVIRKKPDNARAHIMRKDDGTSFDPELTRVLIPYSWWNLYYGVEGDVLPPLPGQTPSEGYLAYGSSITHGGNSPLPTLTCSNLLALKLGMDLYNLGFAGTARMDAAIAEHIYARTDWKIATLELGINIMSWPVDRFYETAKRFVAIIAQACPERRVYLTDIFFRYSDFTDDPQLEAYRQTVKRIARELARPGLTYVRGDGLLRHNWGLTCDGEHPTAMGFMEMAENWHRIITTRG